MVRLQIQNLASLRQIDFEIPEGLSVLVGPNGSGKSTLLGVLEVLRQAYERGLADAVSRYFGGAAYLRHYGAPREAPLTLQLCMDALAWSLELRTTSGSLDQASPESLSLNDEVLLQREPGSAEVRYRGRRLPSAERMALRTAFEHDPGDENLQKLNSFIKGYRAYRSYNYQLLDLMQYGSRGTTDRSLDPDARNAFSVLRNWVLQRPLRPRYEFVRDSLRTAFPGYFDDFDFDLAGDTVTLKIITARWGESPVPIARESTGFVLSLLGLCAVASGEHGGMVAIDEIENSLHPAAIQRLIECIREYAQDNRLRVLLATHSPVVLDQFRDEPSQVFVMQTGELPLPIQLTRLLNSEWLQQFSLGRLYTSLDFGAPRLPETD